MLFRSAGQENPRLVVVVLLRGQSRRVNGPTAADIAGRIYSRLHERNFFAELRGRETVAFGASH